MRCTERRTSARANSDCLSLVWGRRDVPSQLVLVFCTSPCDCCCCCYCWCCCCAAAAVVNTSTYPPRGAHRVRFSWSPGPNPHGGMGYGDLLVVWYIGKTPCATVCVGGIVRENTPDMVWYVRGMVWYVLTVLCGKPTVYGMVSLLYGTMVRCRGCIIRLNLPGGMVCI